VVLALYVMTAILYVIRWRIGNQRSCLRNSMALTECGAWHWRSGHLPLTDS